MIPQLTISFDLWGTLIKGNPEFKKVKNDLIRSYSTSVSKNFMPDAWIEKEIKLIKKSNDDIIEEYGTQPNIMHLFAAMAQRFEIPAHKLNSFFSDYQAKFLEYPPLIYSEETLEVLKMLHSEGHILHISSNTLFTSGPAMESMVLSSPLGGLFFGGQWLFSDKAGISKPSRHMFILSADIHVGDNANTDGGCEKFGIEFFQINSNTKTIKDFYDSVSLLQTN